MSWERLTIVRTAVLVLAGFAALCVGAFLWCAIAGWCAVGVSLLLVEFLTNPASLARGGAR